MAMEQCRYRFRARPFRGAVESSKSLISDLKLCWRTASKCSGCNMFIPFLGKVKTSIPEICNIKFVVVLAPRC